MIPYAAFCFSTWGLDFCHACAFLLLERLQTPERKRDTLMQNCVATTVVWPAPTMHLAAYMQASYVQASYVEHILRSILPEHFATLAFLTRSLFAMSGNLLDEAITKANAKDSTVRALFEPKCYRVDHNQDSLSLRDFLDGACRPLGQLKSTVAVLFDAHFSIPEFGRASTVGDLVRCGRLDDMPDSIRFKSPLPLTAKVDLIICNLGDGLVDVLKVVYFEKPVQKQVAQAVALGSAHAPLFRPGPWAVKKALQLLLDRLAGYHVRQHVLEDKAPASLRRSSSALAWTPDNDELSAGIRFINEHAPECDARNEQTFWVLTSIKSDADTPIAGWPEAKVRAMAQNKSRGLGGATSMTEFPLTTFSLNPAMHDHILRHVYPLLVTTAVMMLGCPGVGKTPAIIAMALAMGRFHVRRLGLQGVLPGWRRAKSLDNFRHKVPQVQEAVFLDDPSRKKVDMADLKSFVTVDEDGTTEGRYNDAKLVRNQMRAIASNWVGEDPSKEDYTDTVLEPKAFLSLVEPFFSGEHMKDILAVLKRSTVFVFTETALYLRLPSEKADAIVHRICVGNVHKDLLDEQDKPLYGSYKQGVTILSPSFHNQVQREQDMIDAAMKEMADFDRQSDYVHFANSEIQKWIMPRRTLAPSQSQSSDDIPSTVPFSVRLADPREPRKRLLNSSTFVYPDATPERRLRRKQSLTPPTARAADSAEADGTTREQEPASSPPCLSESAPGEPMDVEDYNADEDAARALHE